MKDENAKNNPKYSGKIQVKIRRSKVNRYLDSGQPVAVIDLLETRKNSGLFKGTLKLSPHTKRFGGDIEVSPREFLSIVYDPNYNQKQKKKIPKLIKVISPISVDPFVELNKRKYEVGNTVKVTIKSPNDNRDPDKVDSFQIHAASDSDSDGFLLQVRETGPDTAVFTGSFILSDAKKPGSLQIKAGDIVKIRYETEFHANYDPDNPHNERQFTVNFVVGSIHEKMFNDEEMIKTLKTYLDRQLVKRLQLGDDLSWTRRKTITVVFWDIRGFSKMCELLKAQPDFAEDFLKDYFELASDVISQYGGILDKFVGDGVMALFGVFGRNTNQHAIDAVDSALQFRERFQQLVAHWNAKWSRTIPQSIQIGLRCGINTGEALVGNIGGKQRNQFTAIGSTVNIASRLEGYAKDMQILVSTPTKSHVEKMFQLSDMIPIKDMKNIDGLFECYEIKGKIANKKKLLSNYMSESFQKNPSDFAKVAMNILNYLSYRSK